MLFRCVFFKQTLWQTTFCGSSFSSFIIHAFFHFVKSYFQSYNIQKNTSVKLVSLDVFFNIFLRQTTFCGSPFSSFIIASFSYFVNTSSIFFNFTYFYIFSFQCTFSIFYCFSFVFCYLFFFKFLWGLFSRPAYFQFFFCVSFFVLCFFTCEFSSFRFASLAGCFFFRVRGLCTCHVFTFYCVLVIVRTQDFRILLYKK